MEKIDLKYVLDLTKELIDIPSVVGFTDEITKRVIKELELFGIEYTLTKKGAVIATVNGESNQDAKMIAVHVDTIGAVVKKIKQNGRLELVNLGGVIWGGMEAENVTIHAFNGKKYQGSLLPLKASAHTYGDEARETIRATDTVEIRIDEDTESFSETCDLGIRVGDCVSFEARTIVTDSGYIKSRFLDDKLCIAQVFGYLKYLNENKLMPKNKTYIYFTNYEEIGHGISVIPEDVNEIISIDIGIVSNDSMSHEKKVSIAMKDFKTIYDVGINRKLIELAEKNNIKFAQDIFNRYGSDGSAAIIQRADVKIACIGPGIDASHHYERTHIQGILETIKLITVYF